MTITLPDNYISFIKWRMVFDNYLREQILNYRKKIDLDLYLNIKIIY